MVRDFGCMVDEEVLQFQGDQSPAVPGVEWHCQDGGKHPSNVLLDISAQVLCQHLPRFSNKEDMIECFFWW
jgi:hypothetical protein